MPKVFAFITSLKEWVFPLKCRKSLMFPSGGGESLKAANQKVIESLLSMQKDLASTIDLVKKEIEKE